MMKKIFHIALLSLLSLTAWAQTIDPDAQPAILTPVGSDAFYTQERGPLYKIRLDTLKSYYTGWIYSDSTSVLQDSILVYYRDAVEVGRDTVNTAGTGSDDQNLSETATTLTSGFVQYEIEIEDGTNAFVYDNDRQSLSLAGNTLSIDNGNSVDLSGVGGVSDGDKGDITVSSSGAVWSIDNGAIGPLQIATGAVGRDAIATAGVDSPEIATGAVGASELESTTVTAGSYTSADITVDEDGRITAASNGSGGGSGVTDGDKGDITVSSSGTVWNIDADAVGAAEIATGAVGAAEIATGAVGASEIATGAVGSSELASTAVAAGTYNLATVTVDEDGRITSASTGSEVDGSTTNELQTISIDSTASSFTITLSDGGGSVSFTDSDSGGSGVSDGDKGDITVSGSGTIWNIDAGAVGATEIGSNAVGSSELASTAVAAGSYTNTNITVDADGRITAASNGSGGGVSDGDKGDITVSSSGTVWNIDTDAVGAAEIAANAVGASEIATGAVGSSELASTAVTAGSYTNTNITVDADGRITAASNGSGGGGTMNDWTIRADDNFSAIISDGEVVDIEGGSLITTSLSGNTVTVSGSNSILTTTTNHSGDVSGNFNNLQIAAGAVGATELASTAVGAGNYNRANITVDTDGRITAASSYNTAYGECYRSNSGAGTFAVSTTPAVLNNMVSGTMSNFTLSSGGYLAYGGSTAGTFLVSYSLSVQESGTDMVLTAVLRKNGSVNATHAYADGNGLASVDEFAGPTSTVTNISGTAIYPLSSGDTISLWVDGSASGNIFINNAMITVVQL